MNHVCRFCGKSYVKESTLAAHLCEPKRRHQQQNDWGVQLGFKAYLRFYEITQGSAKLKTYEDFSSSPYYTAFVKYGWHTMAIRVVNFSSYTEWLLKNNKKLDNWCKDSLYLEWLCEYIKKESVQDALERALREMQDYADNDKNSKIQGNFSEYFSLGAPNRIVHHISTGRVSPWIVYNCGSGQGFLSKLNEEQVSMIMPWIDPDHWQRKFKDYAADTEWIKDILLGAGL
jgi:hypothetical protein